MTGSATLPSSSRRPRPWRYGFSGGFADIFDEMFGEFMGGGRRGQAGPSRGSNVRYNLEISRSESFRGKQTTIRIPNLVACDQCNGSGAEAGSKPVSCPTCHGRGRVAPSKVSFGESAPAAAARARDGSSRSRAKVGGRGRVARENFVGQHPARDRGRPHSLSWRGRVRGAPAAPATSICSSALAPHSSFSATARACRCRVPAG